MNSKMRDELKNLTWKLLDGTAKEHLEEDVCFKVIHSPQTDRMISFPHKITSEYVHAVQVLRRKAKAQRKFLSDRKIETLLDNYIMDLKYSTSANMNNEIDGRITELFEAVRCSPNERHIFLIPSVNLVVNIDVTIGDSTILRLTLETFRQLQKKYGLRFPVRSIDIESQVSDLVKINETEFFIKVLTDAADHEKAKEMAFEKAETVLNVLRLYTLNEHIALRGEGFARVNRDIISANLSKKVFSESFSSVNDPSPALYIDKHLVEKMLEFRLGSMNSLLTQERRTMNELQKNLLTAIFWFGGAVKDRHRVSKYIKYIVAMETLLLRGERSKKEIISKRLASILYKEAEPQQAKEAYCLMKRLYQARNDIIHAGRDHVEGEDVGQVKYWCQALIFCLLDYANQYQDILSLVEKEFYVDDDIFA